MRYEMYSDDDLQAVWEVLTIRFGQRFPDPELSKHD